MSNDFSSIPILSYALLSSASTRPSFIAALQHALTHVGFFYLSDTAAAVDPASVAAVIAYAPQFFDLTEKEKEKVAMLNSEHFFGWTRVGAERTKGRVDWREQFDFGTEWKGREAEAEADAEYRRLWGPPQWPGETVLPGFRTAYERYVRQLNALGNELVALVAEALHIPLASLSKFLHTASGKPAQHRAKIVKYPVPEDDADDQGVGPHFDGGFLTLLLQASPHKGLQVQNRAGEWVAADPIPGTFVVNIGKALETVTQGVAIATSHRVLSPAKGSAPRYSIPFFQMIRQDLVIGKSVLDIPPEIIALKEARGDVQHESINYAEYGELPAGQVALIGRVKSHPDVGQRHYPEVFKRFFPDGLPTHGSAY